MIQQNLIREEAALLLSTLCSLMQSITVITVTPAGCEFVAVEISLAFFVAELFTTLIFFPDAFVQDKGDLIHHVFGVVGLLISVYRLNAIAMFRLLSQLSLPFLLLRLYLLECGKRDTLVYLLVYTALILVHFVSLIAIFPWHWRLFAFSVQTEDATLAANAMTN